MSIDSISSLGSVNSYQSSQPSISHDVSKAREMAETAEVQQAERIVAGDHDTVENSADGEDSKASVNAVKKAVNEINKKSTNSTVQFGVHEETNRMTIKILDKDTRKVVKEFPAEKSLDLIAKALEMAGMLVDEKR